MADLDHSLSLADALTEPPPDVEEEVKRDFIATLEAEKFDDVVGETVDKTDYVPLLDDEDQARPGSQEPKSKGHVDGIAVEHSSASGPMVVENGDHGLQDHHTVFPGEIMDEKMSYKEFLDRNDSWSAEERDLCFKPMDMADPFSMHRGENLQELSFPTDMKSAPLFPGHADAARDILAPHGSMMGPEQPFLGSLYSPAEALDPSAFIGLESGTEFLPGKAAPEEYWMGAQQDMKGPDTSFFVEPPVPPAATEAIRTSLPESPTAAAAPGNDPAAAPALPAEAAATEGPKAAAPGAAPVPAASAPSLPAEKVGAGPAGDTKPPQSPAAAATAASPFQATDGGFAPAPEASPAKGVNDVSTPGTELGFAPAADAGSHHGVDLGFAPAAGMESHQAMDLGFAPAAGMESHQTMDLGFAPAVGVESHQAMDFGFAPAAGVESHQTMDLGFAPAAGVESHQNMDLGLAPAAGVESHQNMDLGFAPAADTEPHHTLDLGFAPAADNKAQHVMGSEFGPAAEVSHHHGLDSGFAPTAPAKPVPAVDGGNVEAQPGPAAAPSIAVSGELLTSEAALQQNKAPAEATAKVEAESKVAEVCVDHSEEIKDRKPPPSPREEEIPGKTKQPPEAAAEAKGALENKDLPEKSAPAENGETQKEEAEHNHVQHKEPQEDKTLQEPTGLSTAQVRQAPKSRDRGFGRAKPAPVPLTDVPKEHPVGVPQQKSPEPRADPCSTVELGCGAGASPRSRVPHKKATSVPTEPEESCRDPPQENWDLEGAMVKKKKKKPKQRRNQLPRGMEFWDENGTASRGARSAPSGVEWQSPAMCPGTAPGSRALDVPQDAKITAGSHILEEKNTFPVPAPGQQGPVCSVLGGSPGEEMEPEGRTGASWMLGSKGQSKEVPSGQVGRAEVQESAAAKGASKAVERDFPRKNEKREDKESKGAELKVNLSTAGAPLQTKPLELPLSHGDKEPKSPSPGREAPGDSVQQPSLETAAKKKWEKSKGLERESLRQPHLETAALEKLPAEPKAAGERGWGVAADPKQGKGVPGCEQQAGTEPSLAHSTDRPKKKRSEGKGKRMKSCSEQMMLSEDGGKSTDGGRTDEAGKETVYPENGQAVPARGHPPASTAQACPADKPKKRGSDGRSKKGERSFFQQPFLENKMDSGNFPEGSDKVKEGSGGAQATVSCAEKGTGRSPAPAGTPGSTGSISPAPAGTPGSTGSCSPAEAAVSQAVPGAGKDRKAGGAEQGRDMRNEQSSPQRQGTEPEAAGTAAQTTQKQPRENKKGPCQPAEEGPALLKDDAPRAGEVLLKDALVSESEGEKPQEKTKAKDSLGKTKEKESQDTTKEGESQNTTREKESQDITKEKESQEVTEEKESQDTAKQKESQDTTKEKKSQEVTKEKEFQDTNKEKESQEITEEKESQDTAKEKESQDTTKEKESRAPAKETEEEREQKVVKEAKKARVKAAEQLKGYMRPTKARGVPALVPALAGRAVPRRPDRGVSKAEEPKAAEAVSGNDITAPPNKELPPSPEKKTKPAASSSTAKAAAAKAKPSASTSPKRPSSATPGTNKKPTSPTAAPAPGTSSKRPGTSSTRPSTLTPKETKPKVADAKPAEKRTSLSKPPSSTTPKTPSRSSSAAPRTTAPSPVTAAAAAKTTAPTPPKRPTSIKTDAKPADAKKPPAKSPSGDSSRPKSAPGSATKSSATTPSTAASSVPGTATSRPKPKAVAPKAATASTVSADAKKAPGKAAGSKGTAGPAPRAPRPASAAGPDLRHVRSKIGSTDNIKHQPGGGKGKVEKRPESAGAAPSSEPSAGTKVAPKVAAKEGVPKQPNGKVQIVSKKANYSHVQSKCGSKDNIKHVPGGGNVQIQNKKVDLSKVSSKCGSKANIKHKPGGGDVKIENQKLNFKEKAQAKVGSLDNVGHSPAGGAVKAEGGAEPAQLPAANGAGPGPGALPAAPALRENGVGPALAALSTADQREMQSLDTHIQETSKCRRAPPGAGGREPGSPGHGGIESHKLTFRAKAKARTDHGAEIVVSKPPTLSSSTCPRRSTSASDSPGSVASPSPLPPPAAPSQQGL
ncbi:unnamed protein product [Coccothraustes coccothraustes]